VGPGAVAHAYNLSYTRARVQEDLSWRLAQTKKLARPHPNQ
jgi:hypothetical protein